MQRNRTSDWISTRNTRVRYENNEKVLKIVAKMKIAKKNYIEISEKVKKGLIMKYPKFRHIASKAPARLSTFEFKFLLWSRATSGALWNS